NSPLTGLQTAEADTMFCSRGQFEVDGQGVTCAECELCGGGNNSFRKQMVQSFFVKLKLSDNNRKVTWGEDQSYPDHPDRFDDCPQLLCRTGLTGRCYWEVEWTEGVRISVTYRGIRRKGSSDDCLFGGNDHSWCLSCSDGYSVRHSNIKTSLSSSSSVSNRVAVYVDCPAGSLSFYRVSSDKLIHLHTFNTTFTEPLYPGFLIGFGSSVSLCDL
uniref:B30.2/SPRY domain-containing protein n=1 Tax=Lates calcarifer TaxID=8187 RepID=A0A4W6EN37_LATCA